MIKGKIISQTYAPGRGPRAPIGMPDGPAEKVEAATGEKPLKIIFNVAGKKPSSWDELHPRALAHPGGSDLFWLLEFTSRIAGTCDCRSHWIDLIRRMPPDFNNYFAWSVAAHNDVNRRLGKPELHLAEALEIWRPNGA